MIKEVNEVSESIAERIKHPFFGPLFLFFIFFNWDLILILFSNYDVSSRIQEIRARASVNSIIWYPLGLNIIYLYMFSPITKIATNWVKEFWLNQEGKILSDHIDADKKSLFKENVELSKLVREFANEQSRSMLIESHYDSLSNRLTNLIEKTQNKPGDVNSNLQRMREDMSKFKEKIQKN